MIVGCYTMDLYCDDARHSVLVPNKIYSLDAQFTGTTAGDCRRQARKKGWKIDGDEARAICPVCAKQESPQP